MKNKVIIAMVFVCLFLGSSISMGINISFNTVTPQVNIEKLIIPLYFPAPRLTENGDYINVDMDDAFYLNQEGYPVLPYQTQVFSFPLGTKIEDIRVKYSRETRFDLTKKIVPSARPVSGNMKEMTHEKPIKREIYFERQPYPEERMTYHIGVGRDDNDPVVFLTVCVYPGQYIPMDNILLWIDNVEITVEYSQQKRPILYNHTHDLLIIAPRDFTPDLQPLVDHKVEYGVDTLLVSLDEIYGGTYFSVAGRDDAEKIKYFIKDALENWGISYVLLVGGRNGGVFTEEWWVPVRYASLKYEDERKFLCDQYFMDIYGYNEGEIVFDDWDSNENDLFGEWSFGKKDVIDMYPDVYVGRLACRNTLEVRIMVEKIITYESTAYGQPWTKHFVAVAGDTYPNDGDPYYEGELATAAAFDLLDSFEGTFLWTSTGALSGEDSIIDTINQGCLFLHFSGHGNPLSWANHPPEDDHTWIGIDATQFYKFINKDMYPIAIVGGCHNNKYNVSLLNLLKLRHLEEIYGHSDWAPECWGWWLARKIGGGSIATIANTGYGMGIAGEDCLTGRGRYMEIQFFQSYSEGKDVLGETYGTDLTYYLHAFPPMTKTIDNKIVLQWALLGDPSLKIGGYP